jgi:hypothetical protein
VKGKELTIEVRVPWNGMVAIRDKYYDEAIKKGLVITHDGKKMTLTPNEVKTRIVQGSKLPYDDKFSINKHRLLYYKWIPD